MLGVWVRLERRMVTVALGAGLQPCAASQPVCPWEHLHWHEVPLSELGPISSPPTQANRVEFSPMKDSIDSPVT